MGEIVKIDPHAPDSYLLAQAAEVLAGGGLVAYPTETLYALGADRASRAALERLVRLKSRVPAKMFTLILPGGGEINKLTKMIPPAAQELMGLHWPGALTIILPAADGLSPRLVSQTGGIAVRLSPHPVAMGLAQALGRAITATSANPGGLPPAASVPQMDPAIIDGVDLVLDAGPTSGEPPSTLVEGRSDPPLILRQGGVVI